ncbi:MAG: asparagine synthase (glutamine-hydrolyzing) [Candidatus Omnitrophota bacterium]
MCGICGIVKTKSEVCPELIRSMTSRLTHRGPDDTGFYFNKRVGLGFRRLSIIDLKKGHQPIPNEDNTVWVIFNGEIYNFKELRKLLEKKGHAFKTLSDTEAIVHSYEEWGADFVNKIKGMFGVAVWDGRSHQLILARDRIGIKPLYYAITENGLYFASEIKSLLANKEELNTQIDLDALNLYLTLNYIPAPLTIFRGIRSLLPAHLLIYKDGQSMFKEYWDIPSGEPISNSLKEEAYMNLLEEQLEKSVNSHLISDVPVGAFLSGGLDSSAVVAFMARIKKEPVKTFSIGFGDKSYSELNYANIVANHFKTEHRWELVKPDIRSILPGIINQFDEPFADSSAIPLYFLSKLARGYVKVVMTGDGGDELFAGYETYLANMLVYFYRKSPGILKMGFRKIVENLPVSHKKVSLDFKAKRFIGGADLPPMLAHLYWRIIFTDSSRRKILNNEAANDFSDDNLQAFFSLFFERATKVKGINKFCYFDIKAYLPNDMLVKVDRMTMVNSLEARVPLLDSDLVELAFRIPSGLKVKNFRTKYIFRRTLKDILPKVILNRKKAGFNVPIASWINNDLKEMFWDVLFSKTAGYNELINLDYVKTMLNEHHRRVKDHSHQLYGLLVLSLWCENMR